MQICIECRELFVILTQFSVRSFDLYGRLRNVPPNVIEYAAKRALKLWRARYTVGLLLEGACTSLADSSTLVTEFRSKIAIARYYNHTPTFYQNPLE